ncbi:MAG TPA: sterol desaturase family protein [Stellaceae bacterium]|jgi:sterol desaturase/sphingolipid hydroxylase (fatty acid hydroxylase superfamily)|nr:sterol desaturase family protein [Stellaceae bacterium]
MIAERLLSWVATVAAVYAIFVVTYVATCLVVERMSRNLVAAKLQARPTAASLIARDRRQSLVSLGGIAAMFGSGHWLYAQFGWGLAPATSLVGMALSFVASMLVFDTWFYWLHRLIHTRRLYPRVHRWHHLTVTPVVWSNNSDRLIDNLFLQSYWLVAHFLVPAAPVVLLAHKLYDQITGVVGHSGYEHGGIWCWPPSPLVGVTHHDQHHRYFRCNYATHFSLWDRLMGTLHPDHDAELRRNITRTAAAKRGSRVPAE